jgi:putative membrane protein
MNNVQAKHYFSATEQETIRAAVAGAERSTSGEIATMVVDRSEDYLDAEVIGTMMITGCLALLVCVAIHHVTVWTFVPLYCLGFFPVRRLFRAFPRLKLPLVSQRRLAHAVRDRAVQAFYEKGLHRTRDENGILIFISLLERKVWILGDRGIHARIPPHDWHDLVRELSAGIRGGDACAALCGVIARCGERLATHFPRKADDVNELPDEILI